MGDEHRSRERVARLARDEERVNPVLSVHPWGVVFGTNLPRYWRLADHGHRTVATVNTADSWNHNTFTYTITVNGRDYAGQGRGGAGNPQTEALKPGAQVFVYYLPSEPDIRYPGEAKERFLEEFVLIVGVITVQGLFTILVWTVKWPVQGSGREAGVVS